MTDILAEAFDRKLQDTIRKEASGGDSLTVTAVVIHKQLIEEGISTDSAQAFLAAHGALSELMHFADEKALELTGAVIPAELRNETLGSAATWVLNAARERKKQAEKAKKARKAGIGIPEGGSVA